MAKSEITTGFPGSFRLFKFAGVNVYLHWSWFLIVLLSLQIRTEFYESIAWNLIEYLSLFGIVLMHEFGHALACRSVGGRADQIVLWPLGGIAFVNPPRRPGAVLWSIAAGPLVNVVLVPITLALAYYSESIFPHASENLHHYLHTMALVNFVLLVFNMLPVYPLDGGQIVQAILWFFVGEQRSLLIVSTIGLVCATAGIIAAAAFQEFWLMIMAVFLASRSWQGRQVARQLATAIEMPVRDGAACGNCGRPPPVGAFWRCRCGRPFDTFEAGFLCPSCGTQSRIAVCPYCGAAGAAEAWYGGAGTVVHARPVSQT